MRKLFSNPVLLLIILYGAGVRLYFLCGFGLGDDITYIDYARDILNGHYPSLELINQYAYRPLLLYAMALSIKIFGVTDFGVVAPFYSISVLSIPLVYFIARLHLEKKAALLAAFLFASYPFNLVGSTTIHNDILLGFFIHLGFFLIFLSDRFYAKAAQFPALLLSGAGGLMFVLAFLVKVSVVPALIAVGGYSLFLSISRRRVSWNHFGFYLTFSLGLCAIGYVYHRLTGDFFWQYRAEFHYYAHHIQVDSDIYNPDMNRQWFYYLNNLFWLDGSPGMRYNEHGEYYWVGLLSVLFLAIKRELRPVSFFVWWILCLVLFLEFYPLQIRPFLVTLPRQSRYLELLSISLPVIMATGLSRLQKRKFLFAAFLCLFTAQGYFHTYRRYLEINDSSSDAEILATYLQQHSLLPTKPLIVDEALYNTLTFYFMARPISQTLKVFRKDDFKMLSDVYLVIGGARPFWWGPSLTLHLRSDQIPSTWKELYRHEAPLYPWRRSVLRLYDVGPILPGRRFGTKQADTRTGR